MTRNFTINNHIHHKLDFKILSINDVITIIEILYNILKLKCNIYYFPFMLSHTSIACWSTFLSLSLSLSHNVEESASIKCYYWVLWEYIPSLSHRGGPLLP